MRAKNGIRKTAGNPYLQARAASLNLFSGIEHRMQKIRNWNDIEFINDSKSTDIESTFFSLELIQTPITWIVGATDSATDYNHVAKFVKYKVVNLIVFGSFSDAAIKKEFSSLVDCYKKENSLENAFGSATSLSKKGHTILFSPACSSFDKYEDYTERGEHFSKLTNDLK